jgi:hypothetical protein
MSVSGWLLLNFFKNIINIKTVGRDVDRGGRKQVTGNRKRGAENQETGNR